MSYPNEVLALALVLASLVGMLWAMFWPRQDQRKAPLPTHWDLVYVDEDGTLLFSMVRVLELNVENHRLVGWCARTGTQRVFKLGKILKATDVQTGERVRLPAGAASRSADGQAGAPSKIKTAAHRRIEARELEAAQASRATRLRQRLHLA
jgi:predicted DNA-binding transcriptional regulator YafY